jgi:hypothetical protein
MKPGTDAFFIKLPGFKTCIYFSFPFNSIVCGSALERGAVKIAAVLEACNRSQIRGEENG